MCTCLYIHTYLHTYRHTKVSVCMCIRKSSRGRHLGFPRHLICLVTLQELGDCGPALPVRAGESLCLRGLWASLRKGLRDLSRTSWQVLWGVTCLVKQWDSAPDPALNMTQKLSQNPAPRKEHIVAGPPVPLRRSRACPLKQLKAASPCG